MFAKTIIDSDAFLDMPLSTQALYFHLSMRADDEGFINNPKKIQRMVGATDGDARMLIEKNFIIPFDSGVVVIKHWRLHNYIQKDRFKHTVYTEERAALQLKENGVYTECVQDVYRLDTQDSIGKVSIDKVSIEEDKKSTKHKYGEYKNVLLTDDEFEKLKSEFADYQQRIERLSSYMASTGKSYKNHLATIRNWARRDIKPKAETSYDMDEFEQRAEALPVYRRKADENTEG